MPYDSEVFAAALRRVEQRRAQAIQENERIKYELYKKIPRLAEIERELAETGIKVAKEILNSSGDTSSKLEKLRSQNLSLQAERAELLVANGYPKEILAINYFCPKCHDTGYCGDSVCDCLRALLREEACKRANAGSPLPLFTFDTFDLSYYPDEHDDRFDFNVRWHMEKVLNHCKNYAADFKHADTSLLMLGKTGLGKTHLALSIANAVIEQGFGVVYDTAQNIFMKMEDENFGRSDKKYTFSVFDCDLLILDELPDYASPFAVNTLYNIINTRMLHHRPMIVSTNLTEKELESRYGERIFSRLIGEFKLLKFFGSDIRQLKLRRKANC
ncbi:AAA ATPase [[Clostridium] cellulosi]|jgi:IstB-like ATP binding protein.|uniref:AAA ATPase n=1 Tax=[Clostridium] cellulosi TaxID=29343 RepID=A0A078KJK7_9FIRM|nr:AAA ATPase [[Clostridium] cellulosi]